MYGLKNVAKENPYCDIMIMMIILINPNNTISEMLRKLLTVFVLVWTSHVMSEKPRRSPLSDPELFCDGCHALVTELARDMEDSGGRGMGLAARIGERSLVRSCDNNGF